MRERLAELKLLNLELIDDSELHAGHAGARGGGHFRLRIVSAAFSGKTVLSRHRLVLDAIGELIPNRIHALSIQALSPDEVK